MAMTMARNMLKKTDTLVPLARAISTNPAPAQGLLYDEAAPYSSIPKESFIKTLIRGARDPDLKLKSHIWFKELFAKHGDILNLSFPGVGDNLVIQDPEDIREVIQACDKNPVEPGFDFFVEYRNKFRKDLFPESAGLIGNHGEEWYKVRSLVQQDMMRPKSALYYIEDISKVCEDFLDLIEKNLGNEREIDDVTPLLYRWALEAVAAIFLDVRLNSLTEPPPPLAKKMIDSVDVLLGDGTAELSFGLNPPLYRYYRTKAYDKFDKATETAVTEMSPIVAQAKKMFKEKKGIPHEMSILEKLIAKCGEDSKIPEVMSLDAVTAGIDTTGNTSAFLLYHLASNPEKQEILFQEINQVVGNKKITPALINDLKYLKAVQHESQRLLPAIGGMSRLTQKDMVIRGYQVPKDTKVTMLWINNMRSERHFEQADKFLPERWLRGCPQHHKAHPYAFIPFGHGSRMCIGRRFAELEVQILAIQILRRYQLVYEGEPLDLITPFVNRPEGPVKIKFIRR